MKEQLNSLRQLQKIDHEIVITQDDLASQPTKDDTANGKVSELQENRKKLAGKIEHSVMKQYEKLRSHIEGSVIALVEDGVCKACNMRLPSNSYHQIQIGTTLCTCPRCRRILFMASKVDTEEAQKSQTIQMDED